MLVCPDMGYTKTKCSLLELISILCCYGIKYDNSFLYIPFCFYQLRNLGWSDLLRLVDNHLVAHFNFQDNLFYSDVFIIQFVSRFNRFSINQYLQSLSLLLFLVSWTLSSPFIEVFTSLFSSVKRDPWDFSSKFWSNFWGSICTLFGNSSTITTFLYAFISYSNAGPDIKSSSQPPDWVICPASTARIL